MIKFSGLSHHHLRGLKRRLFLGLLIAQICIMPYAQAQVDAGALQQNLEKQLPLPSPLALPEPSKANPNKPSEPQQGENRLVVSAFDLEGVNLIPGDEVQAAIKEWVGVRVSFGDLQKVCEAIQSLYQSKGYAVQAILPPQKISNGVVRIYITEAKMGGVIVETPQGETRFSKKRAAEYITYANPIGDPLNRPALERAIIILNETPGVMVSSQLVKGDGEGETGVVLQLTEPDLVRGRVEANNYGSRTTGANQGVFGLNLNGPLGIGDSASINGIASEGSQYIQGAISLPGSMDGLRLGVAGTYLQYKNVSNYAYNGGAGDAWTAGLSAAYPLVRSGGANLNASINYDIKGYNNRNLTSNTVTSAYNINDLSAGFSGNISDDLLGLYAVNNGSITAVLGYLDILATSPSSYSAYQVANTYPPLYNRYTPATFSKLTFSGNRNQQITEDGATSLILAASGQFASTNLNSAEQFYLGGPYAVRAYPVAQSGGAQGGLLTIELRHQIMPNLTAASFFDAGVVQQNKFLYPGWQGLTNANNTYSLMGVGLGLNWSYEGWAIGAMVAWKVGQNPLYSQTGQHVNTDGTTTQPRGWLTGSYSF